MLRKPEGLRAVLAVALTGSALTAGGCGGETSEAPSVPGGATDIDLTAREANCDDWNRADVEERGVLIEALEVTEGAPTTGGTPAILEPERAYDVLDNYCAASFASGFKLYKLYARAAAFQQPPGAPQTPP